MFFVLLAVFILIFFYYWYAIREVELNDKARDKAPGEFVRLSHGLVHYQFDETGNGPVIVLIHGFSIPCFLWDPNYRALINQGFQVLRFDLYGRGFSDRPNAKYDISLYVEQLNELLECLNISRPVCLSGISMGGLISAAFTNRYPHKVAKLALLAPVTHVRSWGVWTHKVLGDFLAVFFLRMILLSHLKKHFLNRNLLTVDFKDCYARQIRYKGSRRAIMLTLNDLVDVNQLPVYEGLSSLTIPMYLLWGKQDQANLYDESLSLKETLPEIEFIGFDHSGHAVNVESATEVNNVLVSFFEE